MGMGTGGYAVGYHAIAHCKRCGDLTLRRWLVYDGHFPDLLVCTDCWDPKHPQDYLPDIHDPETIYKPTGDLDEPTANLSIIHYPPLKFYTGYGYPTLGQEAIEDSATLGLDVFPNGPKQVRPRLESPVKFGGRPAPLTAPFGEPGLVTLGLDTNNKFTIAGGGVTDA